MLLSRVRVTRLSYDQVDQQIDNDPFRSLFLLTTAVRERRRSNAAVMIDFPEVRISLEEGQVSIRPLPSLRSRTLVEEAMILAGSETARFAAQNGVRLAFSQQDPPETADRPAALSGMFALRRLLKRSRYQASPGVHSGLGVSAYTQVTSPLRRYLDLVGHQQLRAFLAGRPGLNETELLERIGAADAVTGAVRQAEFLSEKHWTLVYLLQHPGWRGEGILVDKRFKSGIVLIPDLALETRVQLLRDLPLDERVPLALSGVNLAQREANFRIQDRPK
jgi:exoribonuclease-2